MGSRKGSRKTKMAAQEAAKARVMAAAAEGLARPKVAKTTKGEPVTPKARVGRPPRLGPDGLPATCNVKDCGAPYRCMGYCSAHYQFARGTEVRANAGGGLCWPLPLTKGNWDPKRHKLPVPRATGRVAS
jgi:hypothetical protein